MQYRKLGKTGLQVSEIGMGTWQLGTSEFWGPMDDAEGIRMVHRALELGCNLFDTAPNYGDTNSERLLGEALKGRREDAVIVGKFGHVPGGGTDFSVDWMHESLSQSLDRLQTDYLDVLLLHNPFPDVQLAENPIWDAMRQLQNEGRIRHFGASVDWAGEVRACLEAGAEVIEVLFSIFHQDARFAFDAVRKYDAGILTKVPLDSGWLTGRFDENSVFDGPRARWTSEQIAERARLVDGLSWLTHGGEKLSHQAIAYLLSYAEVSSVIPGAHSLSQLEDNLAPVGHRLSADHRLQLERYWDEFTQQGTKLLPW
ncbi:aldo/keto reductase [Persicirhabdus sediminis]|uniref:Aldo/keto reductase n=1 Tax=Persicirhabdus sediminis TaxID=454144 RepID=A0A8J7MDF5_9BACT|nr:aldo/keto reductase [Persicirhabdus sediminis]MBK1790582.1 aldo/keto reductase [Persicirhabdus sediminis]